MSNPFYKVLENLIGAAKNRQPGMPRGTAKISTDDLEQLLDDWKRLDRKVREQPAEQRLLRPLRIVTLAQLALMPAGTIISPINIVPTVDDEKRMVMDFDIQGTLQLRPMAKVVGMNGGWLETVDLLPDVKVVDGRLEWNVSEHSYTVPNDFHPHRFVVWEDS